MTKLAEKKCLPCEGGVVSALTKTEAQELAGKLEGWELIEDNELQQRFSFTNFYKTMAFVNAIAWIANQENHHPDLSVGYNYCTVNLKTHAISGLTENDFIVAAKIDQLTNRGS